MPFLWIYAFIAYVCFLFWLDDRTSRQAPRAREGQ